MRTRLKKMIFIVPAAIAGMLLFAAVGGELVKLLWNWLLPTLFGWRQIDFWQGFGLLALCRILFGRSGGWGAPRSGYRRRMAERWERMTPDERERFRRSFRGRCGPFDPPEATPNA